MVTVHLTIFIIELIVPNLPKLNPHIPSIDCQLYSPIVDNILNLEKLYSIYTNFRGSLKLRVHLALSITRNNKRYTPIRAEEYNYTYSNSLVARCLIVGFTNASHSKNPGEYGSLKAVISSSLSGSHSSEILNESNELYAAEEAFLGFRTYISPGDHRIKHSNEPANSQLKREALERVNDLNYNGNSRTWDPKRRPQPSTIHLNCLEPPCDKTCRSSQRREQDSLLYTLQPTQRHENGPWHTPSDRLPVFVPRKHLDSGGNRIVFGCDKIGEIVLFGNKMYAASVNFVSIGQMAASDVMWYSTGNSTFMDSELEKTRFSFPDNCRNCATDVAHKVVGDFAHESELSFLLKLPQMPDSGDGKTRFCVSFASALSLNVFDDMLMLDSSDSGKLQVTATISLNVSLLFGEVACIEPEHEEGVAEIVVSVEVSNDRSVLEDVEFVCELNDEEEFS
uniref:Uncharacterized protein n=1 Tax=Glossina pallidipes TaxID=7398 RepID=A0A1A9Z7P5_GLOPL